jgi:hypothetical protein
MTHTNFCIISGITDTVFSVSTLKYTEIFKAGLRKPLLVLCTILPMHKICTVALYKTETIPFQSLSM